jgi:hypothetical protein
VKQPGIAQGRSRTPLLQEFARAEEMSQQAIAGMFHRAGVGLAQELEAAL